MFAKKSLGQNFLKSESALNTIVSAGKITADDLVLEIGPGQGALTEKILATGAKILAIEKDSELIEYLENKFSQEIQKGQLILKNKDILEFNENEESLFVKQKYKLIANIPYYITGAIIRKFLSSDNKPELAVLLAQKEVADRIVANPQKIGSDKNPKNKESLLSISVKTYAEPRFIKTVPAGSFAPSPKVDSAIILLENIRNNPALPNIQDENNFFDLLHAGFAHKRKVLRKNLENFTTQYKIPKERIAETLTKINKPETVRAEELSLEDWISLYHNLCLNK